jgi:hypothetical protein
VGGFKIVRKATGQEHDELVNVFRRANIRPLTISMTPSFMYEGDWLLRAQLRCLSEQTVKDFDVLIVDPHFSKRSGYMKELAEHYKLHIVHVPYTPNQHIAKRLDCAVFNAAYCFSESPRIVRYSCWRFVRPDFTKVCLESETNVDFYFHSCDPLNRENRDDNSATNHDTKIWNFGSDVVNWGEIPQRAGVPGASWNSDSDKDAFPALFPLNCYGNYMVFRKDWLSLNGCDEVFTNLLHYEDLDFCIRANNAKLTCSRKAHILYRLHHWYGSFSGRANIKPDHEFKRCCAECERVQSVLEPNRFDLWNRIKRGEIEFFEDEKIWVCKKCFLSGPIYHADYGEHTEYIRRMGRTQASIIPEFKIGRNLRILIADMDGKPLAEKVDIYNRSWMDERYYQNKINI